MTFDFDMIQKSYQALPGRIEAIRSLLQKPLTLTEKILYAHLFDQNSLQYY
jgi:aconitate hydratase